MKTNANKFQPNIKSIVRYKWITRIKNQIIKRYISMKYHTGMADDFAWNMYHEFYGPENVAEEMFWTYDLNEVDFKVISGNIFIIADSKPLNPSNRAILEAIINLPGISSIHEIGTGGGKHIVNLRRILGESVILSASDVVEGQLALFKKRWPDDYLHINPRIHDITKGPLTVESGTDVVFAATVLMHIRGSNKYLSALTNLLHSAKKYVVLIENWGVHNYVEDIRQILLQETDPKRSAEIYQYNSGATKALVIALNGESLPSSYCAIKSTSDLQS